jgi:hypothetical protein
MLSLHHKDQFSPLHEFGRQWILSVAIKACRSALDTWMIRIDLFSSRAAPAVHAADKENALQSF